MTSSPSRLSGRILTPSGWLLGHVDYSDRVLRLHEDSTVSPDRIILPGFIDLHVHGAAGVDIMEGAMEGRNSAEQVARAHAQHGTTALLGTTMTASPASIEHALEGLSAAISERAERGSGMARILGVHLEGPFISAKRLGAQPNVVCSATLEVVRHYHAIAPIKVLTLAPELSGHLALIPQLNELGIRVQIGHSAGSYEDGLAALQAGVAGFTHLFNGMTPLNHYQPGIVGAALAHAQFAELIPDLQHVHPGAMRAAIRAIPQLYCVTDATSATGMPDGEYALGSQRVLKCLGCVRLASGSLAGSALTMDQALRNLCEIGIDLAAASHMLSRNPADYLGLPDRGRIEPGAWADLLAFDSDLQLTSVVIEGEALTLQPAPHSAKDSAP
ncbi:N-acetylglucosamine-6-phosphate deacetylase [Paucibacter sp. Y2R2-4]|uniref:N-acetylglucosamine-6-phosphate deacetylase n=1 Tax=Paucibacter sp. Y2R2-4 TaxID=2893553 RepID=UPI0021E4E951|nr:N-acetylglucosamine-6-phosphate deacetylase [Paucibacter sp. Y2R2-4]MCV2351496.1 N-acetylglucosamine-6-phosphate deacetylase [Paucibacter sp. Y2R2-4]